MMDDLKDLVVGTLPAGYGPGHKDYELDMRRVREMSERFKKMDGDILPWEWNMIVKQIESNSVPALDSALRLISYLKNGVKA
jgi:hypothetical protein